MVADRPDAVAVAEATERFPPLDRVTLHVRSCYNCHRRKVRCDKGQPCARCARGSKICTYPPVGQRIQRPRKTTMAWVANRLYTLEKRLPVVPSSPSASRTPAAGAASPDSNPPHSPARRPTTAATPGEAEHYFGNEILVQKGSHSEYFNEPLHSRMIEQQKDIQSVLTEPPASEHELLSRFSIYNPMGILPAASSSQPCSSFFPRKQTALKLWNTYVERIDACSGIKVLHVPTEEARICGTIENPASAQPEELATCYAVFFATMAVLDRTEAQALLQQDDPFTVQFRCKAGFEQALAEAEVLDKPTFPMLCALTLYLSALQLHSRGKGIWILNGLALRIAQALGLHRDGERLGLSPFQAELRRRVWWHIISRDGRAAEDFGLQGFCSRRSDARLPLPVDDTDLRPDMLALPPARSGVFTAMTLPLASFEITRAVRRLGHIAAAATPASPPDESDRVQIIQETRQRVDELLAGCNPVIPRHRLALLTSRLAMRNADLVSRQQWLALRYRKHNDDGSESGGDTMLLPTDEDLVESLDVLDLALQMWSDEMLRPYSWLWRTNPEYHLVMYLLWHLCVQPQGPNVERAWVTLDRWFTVNREMGGGLGQKGVILAALRRKAEAVRDARANTKTAGREGGGGGGGHGAGGTRQHNANPCVMQVQAQLADEASDASWGSLREDNEWAGDLNQVPDWSAFVPAFQLDGQDFPGMSWFN
ncbi:fungal-specific transcription factor [Chaetomium strumarium]|uniref:Fungal-specific transcription factor n=1 Tax=Chaetomium strumarium TaxID=1170767 RepID=A0AAJ0M5A5_9PEZI|nr:fungal-specific transcription factor [Chaetomium strumarium]